MPIRHALLFLAALCVAAPACADQALAAHFFFYQPEAGKTAAFEQGYRRHLEWHREHHDPLAWYGWSVTDGPRAGQFVDASMGEPFAAFDRRVDPAGDAANAKINVLPFATSLSSPTYVLRAELGTGTPLEQGRPGATVQVSVFYLRPGREARFERAVAVARRTLAAQSGMPAHTWYRLVVGGEAPQYMLMVSRKDWSSYDGFERDLAGLLAGDDAALEDYAASVRSVEVETWSYRPELSLLPPKGS
jgi:hypothetical protein